VHVRDLGVPPGGRDDLRRGRALDLLTDRLGGGSLLHPLRSLGRRLLRRGLLDPGSWIGRAMALMHTPLDAVELASDAVARGNRKVFAEIGLESAHWLAGESGFLDSLRAGDPPDGQRLLRAAFERYDAAVREPADRPA
jgi:hypothetical protein